jgi:DNA end-binding protein Ku
VATESKRRSIWSGALSFGLVNVPVRLFTAIATHDFHFHEYQGSTGQRIHHKRVAEKSGREVPFQQIVKGYEVGRGKVVTLEPEEIDSIEPRKSKTIEIEQFVELTEIDPIVWDTTYYIGPSDTAGAGKSYALLLRAMEDTGRVGIGRFVMRTKEYLVTVRPLGAGLVLETMHYPDEIRRQSELGAVAPKVAVAPKELGLARQLIDALTDKWNHDRFKDTYRDRVEALIAKKAKGQKIEIEEAPEEGGEVVDLMEALKASLGNGTKQQANGAGSRGRGKSTRSAPAASKSGEGRRKAKRAGSRRAA